MAKGKFSDQAKPNEKKQSGMDPVVSGVALDGFPLSEADKIIHNLPTDENGMVKIPVGDAFSASVEVKDENVIKVTPADDADKYENATISVNQGDGSSYEPTTIIAENATVEEASTATVTSVAVGEPTYEGYKSGATLEPISAKEYQEGIGNIFADLYSKLNTCQKEFVSQFDDDFQKELLLRIEKERIEKEKLIIEEWKKACQEGGNILLFETNDVAQMNLQQLAQRLPQLARAAEKQGKHALAGEFHNLLNVAGQALNRLNSLSKEALNFNLD